MKISDIANEELINFINKYSENNNEEFSLEKVIKNSKSKEIIVPVLGMQGMGKSTLINAILGENILPNDADETTCVPVEVKYGEKEYALVSFSDKDTKEIVYTREELNTFVDNNCNPGNEKNVLKIELYRKLDFLKKGLVIVDLPGVGSMTKANEATTNHYIENLCTAIFVIPTVPCIRKMEALFIKGVWSQFTSAIFVQNDWGETELELKDSVEYNRLQLQKIASEINNPFDGNILVVNAYNGIYGKLNNMPEVVEKSNINILKLAVSDLAESWEDSKEKNLMQKLCLTLLWIKNTISKKLEEINKSAEEVIKSRQKDYEDYIATTRKLEENSNNIKKYLRTRSDEISSFTRIKANDCIGKIRSGIYQIIDKGVVDGEQLTEAFTHIQEQETTAFFEEIFGEFIDTKFELEKRMNELEEILQIENNLAFDPLTFKSESKFKFEKSFEPALNIGGGIGGFFLGEVAGPAAAAALVKAGALSGSAAGPAGIAIGAVVGIAVWGVASLIGHLSKKGVVKHRGNEAKKSISPMIDEIERILKKTISERFDEISEGVIKKLNKMIEERNSQSVIIRQKISEPVINSDSLQLENDFNYVTEKIKEIGVN